MGLAKDERKAILAQQGCLGKAAPDEPIFILRGQDILAADLVEQWADAAEFYRAPPEKVAEARATAQLMRQWTPQKYPD